MNALQTLQQRYDLGEARAIYELVLKQRFGLSRTDILLGKDTTLSAKDKEELQIIIDRVAKGEPVQYVLGCEEFCGRTFLVNPNVLIPRPETQLLVELVKQNVVPGNSVLDVGTGSGCIAITLALAGYKVTAIDVSDEALAIAKQNAEQLGADVEFVKGDIFQCSMLTSSSKSFNVQWNAIVSNPPYICESEASTMEENVLGYEPHLALFVPDDDPLLFYRVIADYGQDHLVDEGHIFFEVNSVYAKQVGELFKQKGYKDTKIVNDQYDKERFVWARKIQD
ncbi:MAG: peptide chain release factor N(5)-glutamine methyltransferase [Bacteroidaceae bacterium]|nr:peptide chain release factor N(5)-glutamine methyltransferase [Bacteroidaceae bacterium]